MDGLVTQNTGGGDELTFLVAWADDEAGETAAERTRGTVTARLCDVVVWDAIEWTWVELLEHLARTWRYLVWEDSLPLRIRPGTVEQLVAQAEMSWRDASPHVREDREERFGEWWETHDLARGLQGIIVPDLVIAREGARAWVASLGGCESLSFGGVRRELIRFGDEIDARLVGCTDERAAVAREAWAAREQASVRDQVVIATGLEPSRIETIEQAEAPHVFWELGPDAEPDSEILAAARMVGWLPDPAIRGILELVRGVGKGTTSDLDALSGTALEELDKLAGRTAFDQGYEISRWLRRVLGLEERSFDPRRALLDWGVGVVEADLKDRAIDAVAAWGPRHGPVVFLNDRPKPAGVRVRATLAHEICHLLVDRAAALPLAEVLGGDAPQHAEARARAFAAELLLPMHVAGRVIAEAADRPRSAVNSLGRKYGVSTEVVAWQVRNSGTPLSPDVQAWLRSKVSRPDAW